MLDYSLRTFKQIPNLHGVVGIIKHLLVFDNYSNCAAASSSRFLYKLKKKITHPIIYFFKSHPSNFLFPIRFHRLRSWTMSQYKNKTLIYNNCTLSCLFFFMYIGALRLTGENDRLQSHDFLLFFFFLEHVRHDGTVTT